MATSYNTPVRQQTVHVWSDNATNVVNDFVFYLHLTIASGKMYIRLWLVSYFTETKFTKNLNSAASLGPTDKHGH